MTLRGFRRGTPSLGDLERQVLATVWDQATVDAQGLHSHLEPARGISLSTVQSTLERLARKGLLYREKHGRAYQYSAAVSRQELTAQMVGELIRSLDTPAGAGAGVIDFSRPVDADTLDQLEQWIAAQRQQGDQDE